MSSHFCKPKHVNNKRRYTLKRSVIHSPHCSNNCPNYHLHGAREIRLQLPVTRRRRRWRGRPFRRCGGFASWLRGRDQRNCRHQGRWGWGSWGSEQSRRRSSPELLLSSSLLLLFVDQQHGGRSQRGGGRGPSFYQQQPSRAWECQLRFQVRVSWYWVAMHWSTLLRNIFICFRENVSID